MNQSVYENVLQKFRQEQRVSYNDQVIFLNAWTRNIELLVDSRFPNMQVIKDVLTLAARYATVIIFDKKFEVEHYSDLFKVRENISKFIEKFEGDELLIASDFKEKICQAVEGLQGPNSEIPLLRPAPNTPDQVFYEAYLLAGGK